MYKNIYIFLILLLTTALLFADKIVTVPDGVDPNALWGSNAVTNNQANVTWNGTTTVSRIGVGTNVMTNALVCRVVGTNGPIAVQPAAVSFSRDTVMSIENNASASLQFAFIAPSGIPMYMVFHTNSEPSNGSGLGYVGYESANNALVFGTDNIERMRINSNSISGNGSGLTSLTYSNIVATNQTITISNNTSVAVAQAQINTLQKFIPYGRTTTIIITGTQTWNNIMSISGFMGGGSLIIRGDNTDASNTNMNQTVFVDFASGATDGFYLEGNSVLTYFQYLKIRISNTVNKSCIYWVSSTMIHWVQYCYCYADSNASNGPVGIRSNGSGGLCYVYLSMFGGLYFGIWANGSRVAADTLQTPITNNIYGVYIGPAGILGRNGNQLTGSTAATLQQGGGIY